MESKKKFIITIDTEGDNQWIYDNAISTNNAKYIPRFQELCEKYNFKPVWLTNYEMANDYFFVEYINDCLNRNTCEVGMHLHAWNNPPEHNIHKILKARDYLIEYPDYIMEEKIKVITYLLEERFQRKIVSHRSGRWALNEIYLQLLEKYGYKVDCSVTPHIDWSKARGSTGINGTDYRNYSEKPFYIYNNILEVPVSIRKQRCFQINRIRNFRNIIGEIKRYIKGEYQWLRPDKFLSNKGLLKLVDSISNEETDYLMFMLHSSEFMPGGSPSFSDESSIEKLFLCIEIIFERISNEYIGATLEEYTNEYKLKYGRR